MSVKVAEPEEVDEPTALLDIYSKLTKQDDENCELRRVGK
jgi:hypothetical protein